MSFQALVHHKTVHLQPNRQDELYYAPDSPMNGNFTCNSTYNLGTCTNIDTALRCKYSGLVAKRHAAVDVPD